MNILEDVGPKIRFLILYLDAQMPLKQISNQIGISYQTIWDWSKKTDQGKDIRTG